jgi:hypothetical protein
MLNPVRGVLHQVSKAIVRAASSGGIEVLHVSADQTEGESASGNEAYTFMEATVAELRQLYWSDTVLASSIKIRLLGTLPGSQIQARNESDDAKESADFIQGITEEIPGSFHGTLREMFKEGLLTGLSISEPVENKINLPEFGDVIGIADIKVRPTESFEEGIIQDIHGNILKFRQTTPTGKIDIEPNRVIYYAHEGSPANPSGVSVVLAPKRWIELKAALASGYDDFIGISAGGMNKCWIPDDDYEAEWSKTLEKMKKLVGNKNLVLPSSYKVETEIPPGHAGYHYVQGILHCNKEIRAGVLLDEILNAEGQKTGSYGSKKVSQSVVYEAYAAEGASFCETVAEQFFRNILIRNGFENHPVPYLISTPPTASDGEIDKVLASLAAAMTSGLIVEQLPPEVQKQIQSAALRTIGVVYEIDMGGDDDSGEESDEEASGIKGATAPVGRRPADIRRLRKEAVETENTAKEKLLEAWESNLPVLKKKLNNAFFDPEGHWKTRDVAKIKLAVETNITTGGTEITKILTDILISRYETGRGDAEKMIPVIAGVSITPMPLSPSAIMKILKQNVILTMGGNYHRMTGNIYHILARAVVGNHSERVAMAQISRYLTDNGINPGRATTIVNTALAQAYEQGRMAIFSQLSDPDGLTPGGIIGYNYSALMDSTTTDICRKYNQHNFRVDDPSAPTDILHYGCRRAWIPIFTGETPWASRDERIWTSLGESASMLAWASTQPASF